MLSQFLPDDAINEATIKTPILKLRGKTLIFGNVVYQIHNISSIGLVNLTTTKSTPSFYWAVLVIGIFLLFIPNTQAQIVGFLTLVFVAWLFFQHNLNKIKEKYGMTIYTNGGTKTILVSKSENFIKKVILELYTVMNSDELKAITFNFETLDASVDNSVQIGTNYGSPIVSGGGSVVGDVVSQV